jgi:hypothetical protein
MMGASTKSPCDVSTGSIDPYHESDALQGLWRVALPREKNSAGTRLPLMAMTQLSAVRDRASAERLGRALRAADVSGDAPLNGLMLGGAALVTSAVLLTIASSAEVVLALVPWILLTIAGVWWLGVALAADAAEERTRGKDEERVLAAAVELLLRDEATAPGTRRIAADYVIGALDPANRDDAAARLLRERSELSEANRPAGQFPESGASRGRARRLPS